MTNIKLMETVLPAAPLKIAALDSCKDLAGKVNNYIVTFRQETLDENLDSPLFSSYQLDNYLVRCNCPRSQRTDRRIDPREGSVYHG